MNKRRKVLITITYNEMGIIIDTKADEVAQPNLQSTCNELATDCISRQAAIDAGLRLCGRDTKAELINLCEASIADSEGWAGGILDYMGELEDLPSTQPEVSRIEQELHGKTPEEQYEFLYWLLLKFGLAYTDSRLAVVEWLRGEKEDG